MQGFYWAALGFGLFAVALAKAGTAHYRRSANREFGKRFEVECSYRALEELAMSGIRAESNLMINGIGDVDIVAYPKGQRIPVEIKSFRRWNQLFVFKGEREGRALVQAERQRRALGAKCGIVWVPQGRMTLMQRLFGAGAGSVSVVFGSERALVKKVKRLAG